MEDRMLSIRFASTQYGYCWTVDFLYLAGAGDLHTIVLHAITQQHGRLLVNDIDYQYLPEAYKPYCVRYSEVEQRWQLPPLPNVERCTVSGSQYRDWYHTRTLLLVCGSAKVYLRDWSTHKTLYRAILDAVAKYLDAPIVSDCAEDAGRR